MSTSTSRRSRGVSLALCVSLWALACGGNPAAIATLPPTPLDDAGPLFETTPTARSAAFVLLTADSVRVLEVDGRLRWERPRPAGSEAVDCGDAICLVRNDAVTLRGRATGADWGRLTSEGPVFAGAFCKDELCAAAWNDPIAREGVLTLRTRNGDEAPPLHVHGEIGAPVIASPADGRSVLAPRDGNEILVARAPTLELRARVPVVSEGVLRIGAEGVLAGVSRLCPLVPPAAQAPEPSCFTPADHLLPTPPFTLGIPAAPASTARPGSAVAFISSPPRASSPERSFVLGPRVAFSFDAERSLRWAAPLPGRPLAMLFADDALIVLTPDGLLRFSDADGGVRVTALERFDAAIALPATGGDEFDFVEGAPPGARSLIPILELTDPAAVPSQVYAAHLLGRDDGESLSGALLAQLDAPRQSPVVRDAIAMALRARTNDTDALVEALEARYDFLAGHRPPPLWAILPALRRAGRADAYEALLPHLDDPATAAEDLPTLVDAIAIFGGPRAHGPLLAFLARYRADSSFETDPEALTLAARRLANEANTDRDLRARLDSLRDAPGTHPEVAEALATRADAREEGDAGAAEDRADSAPRPPASEASADAPWEASQDSIDTAARAQGERLAPCAAQLGPGRVARVRFILQPEGEVGLVVSTGGSALQTCIAEVVPTLRWPSIRSPRQEVSFYLRGPERGVATARLATEWWEPAAARAPRGITPRPGHPWFAPLERTEPGNEDGPGDSWWREDTTDRWWRPAPPSAYDAD